MSEDIFTSQVNPLKFCWGNLNKEPAWNYPARGSEEHPARENDRLKRIQLLRYWGRQTKEVVKTIRHGKYRRLRQGAILKTARGAVPKITNVFYGGGNG